MMNDLDATAGDVIQSSWTGSNEAYPREKTVAALFRECVDAAGDKDAVVLPREAGASSISYRELNRRSNLLRAELESLGVMPGATVGIFMGRSIEMIVAMLAVLKARATYVPMDPAYPAERLRFMLNDVAPAVVLAEPATVGALGAFSGKSLTLFDGWGSDKDATDADEPEGVATDVAYVMYTSGSTGIPKGVAIPNRGIVRLVRGNHFSPLDSACVFLQLAPISFDASTLEIWGPLLNGGTCVLFPGCGVPDFAKLKAVIERHQVTHLWLTASLFNLIVDERPDVLVAVKELLTGGEALSVSHIRKAYSALRNTQIVNGYGPTESTTFACCYRIPREIGTELTSIPIGTPIANTQVFVLDDQRKPSAVNVPGELYIGGDGLAKGYWQRPDLTEERFVRNAHSAGAESRLYKTGDKVRWLPTGVIEFLGRTDDQVKLRGHRIELGEIANVLMKHPNVGACVVIVREDIPGDRRLVAYVTSRQPGSKPTTGSMLEFLGALLPEYMIPSAFVTVERIPLTANGKADREALPPPGHARPELNQAYVGSRNRLEAMLVDMWRELLQLDRVGINDRFFELGGTSLLAAQFIRRLSSTLGQSIPMVALFEAPTISEIAQVLSADFPAATAGLVPSVARIDAKLAPSCGYQPTARRSRIGTQDDEIAVIGMAGRFPKARNIDELWANLEQGVEGVVSICAEDLVRNGKDPSVLEQPDYVAATFALEDADCFDAAFFGMSPREAGTTDPQIRLMLETAWAALEHAGYDPERYSGRIGVFGGVGRNSYLLNQLLSHRDLREAAGEYHMLVGNERDFPTTHVSYRLNLTGPSFDVQTACSTSGVALHLACQSLRSGDSDMAIAGGCKVICPNREGYWYVEGGPLAPQGHIRAFSADANGMVRGSGCADLVLKRLSDALRDGDTVYALIKGSAINNDGSDKIGFTAPSVRGQASVIQAALIDAAVSADDISYVETHGTGTKLGDPIEVAGLTRAFRATTSRVGFCGIGSIKTNVGHLDAGATAAGAIKTILSLIHEKLPPSLNFSAPNPEIDFASSPFYVNDKLRSWPRQPGQPRRAGVSSFGLGGTNVHIVIEEAPELPPTSPGGNAQLLVLSAKTESALRAATEQLASRLESDQEINLADVAYTLQVGRRAFGFRCALVVKDRQDAVSCLRSRDWQRHPCAANVQSAPPMVFMFPGAGAQFVNARLYETEPVFRAEVDRCADLLLPLIAEDIRQLVFVNCDDETVRSNLKRPSLAFPVLFTVEVALARMWQSLGLKPDAMIGHGAGEYAAAYLAGVMSLGDALALASCRGRLFEKLPEGGMLSVPLSETDALQYAVDGLCVAAINRPNLTVLSGPIVSIERAQAVLASKDVDCARVPIGIAAQSGMVEPILDELRELLATLKLCPPEVPFISSVTGTWIDAEQATDPEYWVQQQRQTVRFSDGLATAIGGTDHVLLEVGPGRVLSGFVQWHPNRTRKTIAVPSMRDPQASLGDEEFLANALSRLWLAGVRIDFGAYHASERRRRVGLPTYPFERTRHWIDAAPAAKSEQAVTTSVTPTGPVLANDERAAAGVLVPVEASAGPVAQELPGAAEERKERILRAAQRIISDLSGLPVADIDPGRPFLELGFDSLFLTQANIRFKSTFGVRTTVGQLLDKLNSLEALAKFLDGQMPADAFKPEVKAAPVAAQVGVASTPTGATPDTLGGIVQMLALLQQQVAALASGGVPLAPVASIAGGAGIGQQPAAAVQAAEAESGAPAASVDKTSPWQPVQKGVSGLDGMTERQRAHVAALMAQVQSRTPTSKKLTQENRAVLSDPRTVQGFKLALKEIVYPIVSDRAAGSRIWDIDGNEYIDLVNGYGAVFFGHAPEFIIREVEQQLRRSVAIGPQTPLAGEVARLVCELTGMERATLCNTGSEAVLAGVRMARTVTGRRRLVTFSGHYHGIFDEVLVKGVKVRGAYRAMPIAPGIRADVVEDVIVLDYGDPTALEQIRAQAAEIALVLVEPIRSRNPARQPIEFLRELRRVTEELDIPLLMDEMVTGFRTHPGGVQALWGVRADIATYGKVLGGGFPIGVVAGSRKYMDTLDGGYWQFGDESRPESDMTWFAGTFVRHPLALAAAKAALTRLRDAGPALQEALAARVQRFADGLNAHFSATGAPLYIEHFSSFFVVKFEPSQAHSNLLFYHLHNRGIYTYEGRPAFITTEHSDKDMQDVANAFRESVAELQRLGFFPGRPTQRDDEILETPLSDGQQEIWLATRFGQHASLAYNMASTLHLKGKLDVAAWQRAFTAVVARHEALRAVPNRDGTSQRILPTNLVTTLLCQVDLQGFDEAERLTELERIKLAEVETPFDLDQGPLIRATLVRLAADEHFFIVTAHHLIADGWSCGVILRDIARIYDEAQTGNCAVTPAPMPFSEWIELEGAQRDSEDRTLAMNYWLEQFQDSVPVLELPTDRVRPSVKTYQARRQNLDIDADLTKAVRQLSTQLGATTFATLLAAFQTLLYRLSAQSDIVVGFSLAGQTNIQGRDLVGHCVNFLPLRMHVSGGSSFAEGVTQARGKIFDAIEHQQFAFGTLIKRLNVRRDPSRVPLMSVAFNLDPSSRGFSVSGLDVKAGSLPRRYENFDMFFNVVEVGDSLQLQCTYNDALWDGSTLARWLNHYREILVSALADPRQRVAHMNLLSSQDKRLLLEEWNPSPSLAETQDSIVSRFEAVVARCPGAIALSLDGQSISYQVLQQRANQLSRYLQEHGVQRGDLVGICLNRSIEMVVGILGILKASAAYVPVDPVNPDERLLFVLTDAKVRVIIAEESVRPRLANLEAHIVCLDSDRVALDRCDHSPLNLAIEPDSLAYVIYTSGSTGRPKGVQVEHKQVVRLFDATHNWFGFNEKDVWTLFHSCAFDFSVWELWGALLYGGKLVLVPYIVSRSPDAFLELLEREGVTVLNQTPSAFRQLVAAECAESAVRPLALRYVIFGGEALELSTLKPWFERRGDGTPSLINMYGITETTVHVTYRPITMRDVEARSGSVIGVPIPDLELYIVDSELQLVPIGVPGEILVGGAGVARGYLNRPELDAERFIASPFRQKGRIYRSGDIARFLPNRDIEYVGRADNQIKIRGFRIELGEIEASILEHDGVRETVVVAHDVDGQKSIAAYCVPKLDTNNPEKYASGSIAQKEDWKNKWALRYQSKPEALEKAARGEEALLNVKVMSELRPSQDRSREEWSELDGTTLARILELKLGDVLDIGCGYGELLMRAAPKANSYFGTDFAELAIQEVEQQLSRAGSLLKHVRVAVREAVDFSGVAPRSLDTVIINSVSQYFPDSTYLIRVIEHSIESLRAGGCIYLGDVKSHCHQFARYTNEQLSRVDPSLPVEQLRRLLDACALNEDELAVDPEFFLALKNQVPRLSRVEFLHRRGEGPNTATRYHYDVCLHVDGGDADLVSFEPWTGNHSLDGVESLLRHGAPDMLCFAGVPNGRLQREHYLSGLLKRPNGPVTAGELIAASENAPSGIDPEALWALSDKTGYRVDVLWTAGNSPVFDVVFRRVTGDRPIRSLPGSASVQQSGYGMPQRYANSPNLKDRAKNLISELKSHVSNRLPDYMVPTHWVLLDALPLTSNGKTDVRALPTPEQVSAADSTQFVEPSTETEKTVASVWRDVMHLARIGAEDNFFELGGHSLLAVQVVVKLREQLNVDLALGTLFTAPTISSLARAIDAQLFLRSVPNELQSAETETFVF